MNAYVFCPSPHLQAQELGGKDLEVTIKGIGFEEVGPKKDNLGVVYFEEVPRGLVLNKTNRNRIVDWHGVETDGWVGKKITLYESEADFDGVTRPCIRVRSRKK
jgi:hypothetical protein